MTKDISAFESDPGSAKDISAFESDPGSAKDISAFESDPDSEKITSGFCLALETIPHRNDIIWQCCKLTQFGPRLTRQMKIRAAGCQQIFLFT